ncbi:uncharacterized protein LOC127241419 isoform X2 [Andrographis paniculata]|nr:uncharacterized protein LOC127241419 isoform X2 [Andrographis paniculata]
MQEDFEKGPLGSWIWMLGGAFSILNLMAPFLYGLLCNWLALLTFIDDNIILSIETLVEAIFPPSKAVFDKIDGLVCTAESLPEHFDGLIRNFPMIIHNKLPFLDWILVHLISWLNSLLSVLNYWGSKNCTTREKEITIDVYCSDRRLAPDRKTTHQVEQPPDPERDHNQIIHSSNLEVSDCDKAVILKSVDRLISSKNEDEEEEEEEPHHYYSYESANSSPFSDCTQEETKATFSPIVSRSDATNCCSTYKDILKKGTTEEEPGETGN